MYVFRCMEVTCIRFSGRNGTISVLWNIYLSSARIPENAFLEFFLQYFAYKLDSFNRKGLTISKSTFAEWGQGLHPWSLRPRGGLFCISSWYYVLAKDCRACSILLIWNKRLDTNDLWLQPRWCEQVPTYISGKGNSSAWSFWGSGFPPLLFLSYSLQDVHITCPFDFHFLEVIWRTPSRVHKKRFTGFPGAKGQLHGDSHLNWSESGFLIYSSCLVWNISLLFTGAWPKGRWAAHCDGKRSWSPSTTWFEGKAFNLVINCMSFVQSGKCGWELEV